VGSISTGKQGDVRQINNAVNVIMLNSHGRSHHPSLFEIQEIGIRVTESASGKVCDPYKKEATSRQCRCGRDYKTVLSQLLSSCSN